jgi:hypothetical protein
MIGKQATSVKYKPMFSSVTMHWRTPVDLFRKLNDEFKFDLDPCPFGGGTESGLLLDWTGRRVFCNPPYGKEISAWLAKAMTADLAVFLLPARTDVDWWHRYALGAQEIRFLKGRLKFIGRDGVKTSAPFPSVVVVFGKLKS